MLYSEHGATAEDLNALPEWHPDRKEFDRRRRADDHSGRGHRPPKPHLPAKARYKLDPDFGESFSLQAFHDWLVYEGAEILGVGGKPDAVRDHVAWRILPQERKRLISFNAQAGWLASLNSFTAIEAFLSGAALPGAIPPIGTMKRPACIMLCCDASVHAKSAGWGAAMIRPGDRFAISTGGAYRERPQSTMVAEAQSIANGIWHFIKSGEIERGAALRIYCDNDAVIDMLNVFEPKHIDSKAWKRASWEAEQAFAAIDRLIAENDLRPKWKKVRGHVRVEAASAPERLNGLADHEARISTGMKAKGAVRR